MNVSALYYHVKSFEHDKNINFLAAGILYIVGHYVSNWSNHFALILCCRRNHTSCSFYIDMFRTLFADWEEWPLRIIVVNKHDNKINKQIHEYNIIFADSYESFLNIGIHAEAKSYNGNEFYFISLQTPDHSSYGEMQKILKYCWQHDLINCVVQLQKENGQLLIFTYFPFTEKTCRQAEAVLVNEYNGTSLTDEILFAKKLKNFYGCPLRVSLCHDPPHVYLSADSKNATYISGGFEGRVFLELAKKLNFSLEVVPPNDCERADKVNKSSLTGALKMLLDNKADISFGAVQKTSEKMLLLTSTKQYYQSRWVILVLKEAYTLTSLEILLYPFGNSIWYLLVVLGIFAFGIVGILKRRLPKHRLKHLEYVLLDFLSIALGMPAFCKPVFSTSRILKATWIIFSMILRTVYGALLFHLIHSSIIRNIPLTVTELVDQNYSLIMDKSTRNGLKGVAVFKTLNFVIMETADHDSPLKYLEEQPIYQARHMAAAISLIRFQYYIQRNRKIDVFKVIPQNVINIELCMYLRKHSFLVDQLDELLLTINDFGIMQALINKYIDRDYIENTHSRNKLLFGLKKLKMIFVLLLIGHVIATIVFITELSHKSIKRIRSIKYFKRFGFNKNV